MSDDEKFPSDAADRFQVRMPPGLRDRIKAAADANNRSMNAEIVATLEEKYPPPIGTKEEEFLGFVSEVIAEYVTGNPVIDQKIASVVYREFASSMRSLIGVPRLNEEQGLNFGQGLSERVERAVKAITDPPSK